jgi:protein gp37
VFVNSMSDIGHARVPTEFVFRTFATMALAPQHQFQVLTKRPRRLRHLLESQKFVDAVWAEMEQLSADDAVPLTRPLREDVHTRVANWNALSPWPLPNVWIGASIESDEYCWRADEPRGIPAAVRFLSLEPLPGPVPSLELSGIDWVIVGGESGPANRPLDLTWVRDIRDRCVDLQVALFFKQVGGLTPKAGGRLLDGRTWNEYPATADVTGRETGARRWLDHQLADLANGSGPGTHPGTPSPASSRAVGAAPFRRPPAGLALRRPKADTAAPSSTMAAGTTSAVR